MNRLFRLKTVILGIAAFFLVLVNLTSSIYAEESAKSAVELLFFFNPGCHHCLKVKNEILPQLLKQADKEVKVRFLDIGEIGNYQLLMELEKKFPLIGKEDRPRIFVGDVILVGEKAIKEKLVEKINRLSGESGSFIRPKPFSKANALLLERFKSFNFLAVTGAGLLDGLNPCAFAVIVFFISFLTLMKYKRKEIAAIGLTFIIAVFITYLMLGLGIFRGLQRLSVFYQIAKGVNLVIGFFALILAFLSFRDFYIYKKRRDFNETKLKLSRQTHNFIHRIISRYFRREEHSGKRRSLIVLSCVTFFVGVLIAVCTAACTGQVYLPTIVFMLGIADLRTRAIRYLVLYNLMYILPLAVIFIVSLLGLKSEKLARWGRERFALMKILLGLLFLSLAIVLIMVGL